MPASSDRFFKVPIPQWKALLGRGDPVLVVSAMEHIARATWAPCDYYDGRRFLQLRRGQFVTTQHRFGQACGLSRKQVRRSWAQLARLGFSRYQAIADQSGPTPGPTSRANVAEYRYTLVTVLAYETYAGRQKPPPEVGGQQQSLFGGQLLNIEDQKVEDRRQKCIQSLKQATTTKKSSNEILEAIADLIEEYCIACRSSLGRPDAVICEEIREIIESHSTEELAEVLRMKLRSGAYPKRSHSFFVTLIKNAFSPDQRKFWEGRLVQKAAADAAERRRRDEDAAWWAEEQERQRRVLADPSASDEDRRWALKLLREAAV